MDARALLLMALVVIWAGRLGTFLFRRVHRVGKDGRFDEIKPSFVRFLGVWTVQGLWVTFTAAAALAAITSGKRAGIDLFAVIGAAIWLMGFAIEAVADAQKDAFGKNPQNKGKFIQTGLWARSRHPTILARFCFGWASPSSRCRFYRVGSLSRLSRRCLWRCCSSRSAAFRC